MTATEIQYAEGPMYGAYGRHSVTFAYREVSPGVCQPVPQGMASPSRSWEPARPAVPTQWAIDGKPIHPDRVPAGALAEIAHRLPDEEHGYRWPPMAGAAEAAEAAPRA